MNSMGMAGIAVRENGNHWTPAATKWTDYTDKKKLQISGPEK
jgi:hypothetical protein